MTTRSLAAAERLASEGIEVEIIDLRTIKPLDWTTIAASIRRTHRAIVVHEACRTAGVGAELSARVGEELFDWLDAPIGRVGARDVPMPFSPPLERFVLPQVEDIVTAARGLV